MESLVSCHRRSHRRSQDTRAKTNGKPAGLDSPISKQASNPLMASGTRTLWPALKRRPSANYPRAQRGMTLEGSGHDLQQSLTDPAPLLVSAEVPAALSALPDHAMLKIIAACTMRHTAVPELKAVRGLDGLCKDVQQQLCRLRPIVRVRVGSLGVAQNFSWLQKRQLAGKGHLPPVLCHPNSLTPAPGPLAAGDPWRIVVCYTGELKTAVVAQVL